MAIEFCDGFELYATANGGAMWDTFGGANIAILPTSGRHGLGCVEMTGQSGCTIKKTTGFTNKQVRIVGFAINFLLESSFGLTLKFLDIATTQCYLNVLQYSGQRSIKMYNSAGVQLGSTYSYTASLDTWDYIEIKVSIADAGTYTVKLNGTQIMTGLGDLQSSANAYCNGIQMEGYAASSPKFRLDDIVVLNTDGSAPQNDFLGDIRIKPDMPVTDIEKQFTPSTGTSNADMVKEKPADTTSYVAHNTWSDRDIYQHQSGLSFMGTVYGVVQTFLAKSTDGVAVGMLPTLKIGTSYYQGSAITPLINTWRYEQKVWATNPATATAWVGTDINSLKAGYQIVAS